MFSGIIESLGRVENIEHEKSNIHLTISCTFCNELKIDQSIAHNGICLTVVNIINNSYTVTAIAETIAKTNLQNLQIQDYINLERCIRINDRLDGHIVQGHVDTTTICTTVTEDNGSWIYTFELPKKYTAHIVDKGSVCVNGVSLTVVNALLDKFSVAIIPYTYEHTNFKQLKENQLVNLEFDILGKYILRHQMIK